MSPADQLKRYTSMNRLGAYVARQPSLDQAPEGESMKPTIRTALLAALLAGALAACGGSPAASEPTAAPAAGSTESSAPAAEGVAKPRPTAVPAPTAKPTATPEPDVSVSLADAVANAKNVKTYRMEMEMSSKGLLDAMAQAGGGAGSPAADAPLMSMTGEFDNGNAHFTMKGMFVAFMGMDPEQGLEMLTVDGKSYVHGPAPMMGATEAAWYAAEQGQASAAQPPVDSSAFFESFGGKDLSKFSKVGSESLDGQSCDIYKGDQEATQAAFESAAGGGGANGMDTIESADLKLWACGDGYVHQMLIDVTGSSKDKPGQKLDFQMNFHLYDFDSADIAIEAPADAKPLETPSFALPTSQP
jgi:hypothetical protein